MQPTVNEIATKTQPIFKKYGISFVALYGSIARGDARPDSDVDFFVEFGRPLGFEYASMRRELKEQLGREVDVITEKSMNEFLRPYIIPDLTPIYGKSDSPYIAQIVRNIEKIRKYLGEEDFAAFAADEKTQSAILMQLQQIGELAKRLSSQAQTEMPSIPWRDVADFRNVVAHDYYEVQLQVVWTIVSEQLAPLEIACTDYLKVHPLI